jgi:replicative DNA helicase
MKAPAFEASSYIPEIEQNILGSLMAGGDGSEVLSMLEEKHFVEYAHKYIFRAIKIATAKYGSCNPVVVVRLLEHEAAEPIKKFSGIEVSGYIASLAGMATSFAGGAKARAKTVIEQWARLSVANEAGKLFASASDPMADVKSVAREAAKEFDDILSELEASAGRQDRIVIGSAAERAVDAAIKAKESGNGLTGITWGLTDINRLTGGIQKRDLTLIGARPSMGKTTFALSAALKAAKSGASVGFVSLEMDAEKLAARALSDFMYHWDCQVPYVDIIRGNVTDRQLEFLAEAQVGISRLPLLIDQMAGQTMSDIRARTERLVKARQDSGNPLQVLFIDHLGLIKASSRYSGNRVNEIAEITSSMKSLARELDIGVVLLSQLNRALETRENKRPQLSDLRDSGAIEQDADTIAFLYRDAYYLEREIGNAAEDTFEKQDKLEACRNEMDFIIAKQRNGSLETVKLFADMAHSAVRNGARQ